MAIIPAKYLHSLGLGALLSAALSRGTDGSNPSPSSGESAANLSFCRIESLSSLFSRISGRDRRAPSRSVLGVADSSPRTSQRKAGSDIAPLLQPRPTSSTEQRGRASRIPLGGVAGLPDRPELRGGAGEVQSISERPCRDVRQVPRVIRHVELTFHAFVARSSSEIWAFARGFSVRWLRAVAVPLSQGKKAMTGKERRRRGYISTPVGRPISRKSELVRAVAGSWRQRGFGRSVHESGH